MDCSYFLSFGVTRWGNILIPSFGGQVVSRRATPYVTTCGSFNDKFGFIKLMAGAKKLSETDNTTEIEMIVRLLPTCERECKEDWKKLRKGRIEVRKRSESPWVYIYGLPFLRRHLQIHNVK